MNPLTSVVRKLFSHDLHDEVCWPSWTEDMQLMFINYSAYLEEYFKQIKIEVDMNILREDSQKYIELYQVREMLYGS